MLSDLQICIEADRELAGAIMTATSLEELRARVRVVIEILNLVAAPVVLPMPSANPRGVGGWDDGCAH